MIRCKAMGILCVSAAISALMPSMQAIAANKTNLPVAYIYISNKLNPSTTAYSPSQIMAYAADAQGRLTPVTGSPFNEDVGSMAVDGLYLEAAANTEQVINSYNIRPDGSLTFAAKTNYALDNSNHCGGAGAIFFDHTGHSLYVQEYQIDCANSGIASYALDTATGMLSHLGKTITGAEYNNDSPASFIGNNKFAYAAGPPGCYIYSVDGFWRAGNGLMGEFNDGAPDYLPGPAGSFRIFAPDLAAADTANYVAVIEVPANPPGCAGLPVRLATYSADSNGMLSTTSTYSNMPTTEIVNPSDLNMAPSGQLLAIAGEEGLQVFHFHGAQPITAYTGLLTTDPITMMFWDNDHHLYAISQKANKLHVFTITNSTYHEAPGSPYAITSPDDIAVQPWPLPWMQQK